MRRCERVRLDESARSNHGIDWWMGWIGATKMPADFSTAVFALQLMKGRKGQAWHWQSGCSQGRSEVGLLVKTDV